MEHGSKLDALNIELADCCADPVRTHARARTRTGPHSGDDDDDGPFLGGGECEGVKLGQLCRRGGMTRADGRTA